MALYQHTPSAPPMAVEFLAERDFAHWLMGKLGASAPPSRLTIRKLRDQGMPCLWIGGRTYFHHDRAWQWVLANCTQSGGAADSVRQARPPSIATSPLIVPSVRRKAG